MSLEVTTETLTAAISASIINTLQDASSVLQLDQRLDLQCEDIARNGAKTVRDILAGPGSRGRSAADMARIIGPLGASVCRASDISLSGAIRLSDVVEQTEETRQKAVASVKKSVRQAVARKITPDSDVEVSARLKTVDNLLTADFIDKVMASLAGTALRQKMRIRGGDVTNVVLESAITSVNRTVQENGTLVSALTSLATAVSTQASVEDTGGSLFERIYKALRWVIFATVAGLVIVGVVLALLRR